MFFYYYYSFLGQVRSQQSAMLHLRNLALGSARTHPLACVTVDVEQDVYAELVDCLSDRVVVQVRVVYEVVARSLD